MLAYGFRPAQGLGILVHIMAAIVTGFLLGLTALLLGVPIWAGALHQAGAVLLLSIVQFCTQVACAELSRPLPHLFRVCGAFGAGYATLATRCHQLQTERSSSDLQPYRSSGTE